MSSLSVAACRPKVKAPGESVKFGVDFTPILRKDTVTPPALAELLTGATPTVTCTAASQTITGGATVATGDLTITAKAVNTAAFQNDETGSIVAIGAGVQFRVVGGVAGGDYEITVTCASASPDSNTRVGILTLQVRSS